VDLADFAQAQRLMDRQLRERWPQRLQAILRTIHPAHPELLGRLPVDYYWSVYQSEWASDVVFAARAEVERLFPQWVRHAFLSYRSTDLLRFLGRPVPRHGEVRATFNGEVLSKVSRREEGTCVKHWVNGNSIKMYDCDRVLRVETTINHPEEFRVYRASESDPDGEKGWRTLRKGVADLHRRAEVSQAANDRYMAAAATMRETTPVKEWAEPLCRRAKAPGQTAGRKVRALNPLAAEDAALLAAVNDPKFAVAGLRNRDIVALLYAQPATTTAERRKRSARVTRLLRLLRGHGLLHKVPHRHRYQVSPEGRTAITTLLAARNADGATLMKNAA
jgi:hypothetical protein